MPLIREPNAAALAAYCAEKGLTVDEVRLGTLKRVECELDNLLTSSLNALHLDDRAALEDLHQQVRLALAGS